MTTPKTNNGKNVTDETAKNTRSCRNRILFPDCVTNDKITDKKTKNRILFPN